LKAYVGVTDSDWFEFLAARPHLEEVNFWQPGEKAVFKALQPGELFLFKLHAPRNFVVGGGIFAGWSRLPVSLAWDVFQEKNGAPTQGQMRERLRKYRRVKPDDSEDYSIGCILLEQPFFLPERYWIPIPQDWAPNIVAGRRYDLSEGLGSRLYEQLQESLRAIQYHPAIESPRPNTVHSEAPVWQAAESTARFGSPQLVRPRLGQGSFRVLVTDAYERRCAMTREKTLPVLQAAHIRPYSEGGQHRLDNGLLLRSDLHVLFDQGYLTVTPSFDIEVSRKISEEFSNGSIYLGLHGKKLRLPVNELEKPNAALLRWHNESKFRG
jgi:putative restriction endonuclease